MRKVVDKKWAELAEIWRKLYNENNCASPYQSYDFLTFTGKGKPQRLDPFRLLGLKELNLVLYVNGEAAAIAPLLIKRKSKKYNVYLRGHFTAANKLDFIYTPKISYEDLKFLLDSIRGLLGQTLFTLDRIPEKSLSCKYLKKYFATGQIVQYECVKIIVPRNYEEWFDALHKSIRKNIKKYKNRLKRENIRWSTEVYYGRPVEKATSKKMLRVYAGRFLTKNNFRFGPLRIFVVFILQIFLSRDKMTRWMNTAPNNFHAILYMGDEIAAFTSGLVCRDDRISFSRLAISDKFSRFGPGGILISSALKYIVEQNKLGNMQIGQMDMNRGGGDGMSYKYSYGGIEYFNFDFIG